MPDYSKGKIYRLECNGLFYYGSTVMSLAQRKAVHRMGKHCSSKILFKMDGEVKIELIENYACSCKRELEEREQYYISNNECINTRKAFRTGQEAKNYNDEWYQKNKDKVKEWYQNNKEHRNEYMKQYRKSKKIKDIK